jgi:hypothetical protein
VGACQQIAKGCGEPNEVGNHRLERWKVSTSPNASPDTRSKSLRSDTSAYVTRLWWERKEVAIEAVLPEPQCRKHRRACANVSCWPVFAAPTAGQRVRCLDEPAVLARRLQSSECDQKRSFAPPPRWSARARNHTLGHRRFDRTHGEYCAPGTGTPKTRPRSAKPMTKRGR